MATYPPRRLLGARPLPSDPRRDPRRSGFTQGCGGSTRNLRFLCTHFQGLAARHHHLLRRALQFYHRLGMEEDKPHLGEIRSRKEHPGHSYNPWPGGQDSKKKKKKKYGPSRETGGIPTKGELIIVLSTTNSFFH
ncbi:uncharacterized protein LOC123001132 isoform X3 [Ursus arctos]|uniref:uncharacterized protein LOC123001132 isoform X3 n=1 Tax=Ursus arctos TaxID=9644 RepID=UPI002547C0E5|nr:uncharacterized protein LOC123001132 isoform X3 [Ursus arctos]